MHFARLANTLLKKKKSVRDTLLLFNINLTANLARNLSVNFFNRLRIMVTSLWPRFLAHPVSESELERLVRDSHDHASVSMSQAGIVSKWLDESS